MLGIRGFRGCSCILNIGKVELGVFAFWGIRGYFRSDDRDGAITSGSILLTSHQGRPSRLGYVTRSGGKFRSFGILATCCRCGGSSWSFLTCLGLGDSG